MNSVYKIILVVVTIIMSAIQIQAQDSIPLSHDTSRLFLKVSYQQGMAMQANKYLRGENVTGKPISEYRSVIIESGWQTYGKKLWQQDYGYPSLGFGFKTLTFPQTSEMGNPMAIYGLFIGPFKRWDKWSFLYQMGFGLSFNWKPYDLHDNPYQIVIGAERAMLISLGFGFQYHLSKYFDLDAGMSFNHCSNGSITKPNLGINILTPQIGLRYNHHGKKDFIVNEIPKYEKEYEWLAQLFFGRKRYNIDTVANGDQDEWLNPGVIYSIIGLTTSINRQISYKSKFGIGIDFMYDESINPKVELVEDEFRKLNTPISDNLALSIFLSYELVISRLSIVLQPGIYVWRDDLESQSSSTFQRFGIKYHIFHNIYAGANLRAYNFQVADFVEVNAGYRIKWK